ncbi:hypothetical protein [Gaetbulibacter aestuarii]|uniref:Lipoprotein n=1 Tax=Gaetbulibacter aestuarii TaxID=1502358 RepID=A0ABW7MX87_9FLAO
MKTIMYLLLLCLLNYNCKNNKDNNPVDTSFLSSNESLVWANEFENAVIYYRFINDVNHPIEYWVKDKDCYQHFLDSLEKNNAITINSKDTLEVTIHDKAGDIDYVEKITLTGMGDYIEALFRYYENGKMYDHGNFRFSKSDLEVDGLKLCEN